LASALGVDVGRLEGEQAYIFVEVSEDLMGTEEAFYDFYLAVVNIVHEQMGFRPGRVYLLKPKSIPLTYNEKIQYFLLKEQYLDGSLNDSGKILYPEY